jgi:hypothetical protein
MPKSKRRIRPAKQKPVGIYDNSTVKEATGTGGIMLVRKGMQLALPVPCVECPLRRDSAPGYLGGYTPEMYVEILHGPASIACHCSPGFHEGVIPLQRHCTGVAAFRANVGHVCEVGGHLSAAHNSTVSVGPDRDLFFASDEEFVAHHKPGQVR